MKIDVVDTDGSKKRSVELPEQFSESYEPGLVKRAIIAIESRTRKSYGASPEAGKKYSSKLSMRRGDYKTPYGKGMSRTPKKTMWKRGMQFGWIGATAPNTVGGREAHPPKAEKIFALKINKKEKNKAMRSALAGLYEAKRLVVASSDIESVEKTKMVEQIVSKMGFREELERAREKTIRSGKGKMRGRRYKNKRGLLIVVGDKCNLVDSFENVPNSDIAVVSSLNPAMIASANGDFRFVLFTENAFNKLAKERLFMEKR